MHRKYRCGEPGVPPASGTASVELLAYVIVPRDMPATWRGVPMRAVGKTSRVVRSRRSGQVTIPAEFRRALGIDDASLLEVTLQDGEVRIKPIESSSEGGAPDWLKEAYLAFAPIREELGGKYSEDELNAAIDQAIAAVRHGRD